MHLLQVNRLASALYIFSLHYLCDYSLDKWI